MQTIHAESSTEVIFWGGIDVPKLDFKKSLGLLTDKERLQAIFAKEEVRLKEH